MIKNLLVPYINIHTLYTVALQKGREEDIPYEYKYFVYLLVLCTG